MRGTISNFIGDGDLAHADITELVRLGKIAAGQERDVIIERRDLVKWGTIKCSLKFDLASMLGSLIFVVV
jgi:hypothetical protein